MKNLLFLPNFVCGMEKQAISSLSNESLYGKRPDELAALCSELGLPRFAAKQIDRFVCDAIADNKYILHEIAPPSPRIARHFASLYRKFLNCSMLLHIAPGHQAVHRYID